MNGFEVLRLSLLKVLGLGILERPAVSKTAQVPGEYADRSPLEESLGGMPMHILEEKAAGLEKLGSTDRLESGTLQILLRERQNLMQSHWFRAPLRAVAIVVERVSIIEGSVYQGPVLVSGNQVVWRRSLTVRADPDISGPVD
jgi:hypothetical protein